MTSGNTSSGAWTFFAWASFVSAAILMAVGVYNLPTEIWVKGYIAMAAFFLVGWAFTLAKTLRDEHEAAKNRPVAETERRGLTVLAN